MSKSKTIENEKESKKFLKGKITSLTKQIRLLEKENERLKKQLEEKPTSVKKKKEKKKLAELEPIDKKQELRNKLLKQLGRE